MRWFLVTLVLLTCVAPAGARGEDPRGYVLVDQHGARFRLADLGGRPTFVTFVASRCSDACPIADAVFARLLQRMKRQRVGANLVTITLDPDYDTPFVMARLAHEFTADPRRWRFASGDPATVRALMRAFGIIAKNDARGIPDVHSTFVYLLDGHVRLARTLLLSTDFVDEALRAARAVRTTYDNLASSP